jgi:hypothetical protein
VVGPEGAEERPLPEISRFFGISIRMYADDHAPPHFHVWYGGVDAPMDIRTLRLAGGRLPPSVLRRVRRWAQAHRAELLADWELAQSRRSPLPIEPLR